MRAGVDVEVEEAVRVAKREGRDPSGQGNRMERVVLGRRAVMADERGGENEAR